MKYSQLLINTSREAPKDATMASHVLLLRGGYVRMLSKGVYSFLPLGWMVVRNIAEVVRQEMNRAGASELLMPFVHPDTIWRETDRWDTFGPELLKFKNREGSEFCIGPTHEEVITDIARREIKSYRRLPINLYQIQTKYRDEPRPRAGLLRCREFIMKDAYSFDADENGARESYKKMLVAYARIMARLGLEFTVVRAGTGAIGGDLSHEFQVLTPSGEDTLLRCSECGYAVNVEIAPVSSVADRREVSAGTPPPSAPLPRAIDTPGMKTVEEVSRFLRVAPQKIIKTIIVVYADKVVAALVRGDRELNLGKLAKLIGEKEIFLAGDAEVERVTGAPVGFAGPVGLKIPIYADFEVEAMGDAVCGANEVDRHLVGVWPGRDFMPVAYGDLRKAQGGDKCPDCGAPLEALLGIEGGQTFYLGTLYSKKMNALFTDRDGTVKPLEMGCYGIGVSRLAAAVVEQKHDERGIIWPVGVAPFDLMVIPLGSDAKIQEGACSLCEELEKVGVCYLLDDRDESPGVKFYDADLLGFPLQAILGAKGMKEGKVELKQRDGSWKEMVPLAAATSRIVELISTMKERLENYAREWEGKILSVAKM